MSKNLKIVGARKSLSVGEVINIAILFVVCVICLYPFWNIYIYAFNDGQDSLRGALYFFPRKPTLANFAMAFKQEDIAQAAKISIIRTLIGTLTSVICVSTLAFAMTKRHLPGYKFFSTYFFITFMFAGGMIPRFLTIKELGLFNNFWVYILPVLYNYWYMILFRSFFDSLPKSIEESAWLDGASPFKVFFRLIIPMSMPVFAAVTLFIGVFHWNDWFTGLFYVKTKDLRPLQTILQLLMSKVNMLERIAETGVNISQIDISSVTPLAVRSAVVVMTVTPIIMIYPFLQRYMVKGIMLGAIKG